MTWNKIICTISVAVICFYNLIVRPSQSLIPPWIYISSCIYSKKLVELIYFCKWFFLLSCFLCIYVYLHLRKLLPTVVSTFALHIYISMRLYIYRYIHRYSIFIASVFLICLVWHLDCLVVYSWWMTVLIIHRWCVVIDIIIGWLDPSSLCS